MKILLIGLIVIFSACSSTNNERNSVVLNLNNELLSKGRITFPDSTIFRFPNGWKNLSENEVLKIDSSIYSKNTHNILGGVKDVESESFLIFSDNLQLGLLRDSLDFKNEVWLGLQFSEFRHNGLDFKQTVLQNSDVVIFKIFIVESNYSIHYYINRKYITLQARTIESSIASITK